MSFFDTHKTIAMLGIPGSGKETQAKRLSEASGGFEVFSTGAWLRDRVSLNDSLGKRISNVMDGGGLMPYWFSSYVFEKKVFQIDQNDGIIFEGTPRKEGEARLFHEVMAWLSRPYVAIHLTLSREEAIRRLRVRRTTGSRTDDRDEAIELRMEVYEQNVPQAVDYLHSEDKVLEVDGERSADEVFEEIMVKLGRYDEGNKL